MKEIKQSFLQKTIPGDNLYAKMTKMDGRFVLPAARIG
jgi:hypothetical protein